MSFMLLRGGPHMDVATDRPVIKAAELEPVARALDLLEQAEATLAAASREAERVRSTAYAEGRQQGIEDVRQGLAAQVERMILDIAEQQRRRDEELATAALAAVEAIVGAAGVAAIGPALVEQALEGFVGDDAVVVEVAPELATRLTAALGDRPQVTIVADEALGPLDCNLRTGRGTIRAGLDVQLAALAERWDAAA